MNQYRRRNTQKILICSYYFLDYYNKEFVYLTFVKLMSKATMLSAPMVKQRSLTYCWS